MAYEIITDIKKIPLTIWVDSQDTNDEILCIMKDYLTYIDKQRYIRGAESLKNRIIESLVSTSLSPIERSSFYIYTRFGQVYLKIFKWNIFRQYVCDLLYPYISTISEESLMSFLEADII